MRLLVATVALVISAQLAALPTDSLQQVGNTTLKVMFLKVYDSALYTDDGAFDGLEPNMALRLHYHRNIKSESLVKATYKEWERQGLYQAGRSDAWLEQLRLIWPDINLDDELLVYANEFMHSEFYYNGQLIGTLEDPLFTEHFLSIWLSPETRYPDARARLVGTRY